MLTDPVFIKDVNDYIEENHVNAEYALKVKTESYAEKLRNSGNDYLAERSHDIEDVFDRVQNVLLNYHTFDIEAVPDDCVIVARTMKTSDAIIMGKRRIAGLALTEGGSSSHVAILAKSYGIPAVVGLENITTAIQDGVDVIVDGEQGEVIESPDPATISEYKTKIIL